MIDFIKEYSPEYRFYIRKLVLSLIAMILVAVSTAAIAYMMKPLLDEILIEKNTSILYVLPVLIIIAYVIKGSGSYLQSYYMSYVGMDIVRKTRDRLLSHLLKLEISFFHQHHSGELLSRVANDINRIQSAVSTSIATLVRETLTAIALISVVIYHSPTLAIFTLIVIPASYYPVKIISKKLKKISHISQKKNSDLTTNLNEIFSNIEIIKAYNTESHEAQQFTRTNQTFFGANLKSAKTSGLVIPVMELFASFSAAAVIWVGGSQVIGGEMSAGSFFSFLTAMFMAVDPIRRISTTYASFQDAIAANERIKYILAFTPEADHGENTASDIDKIEFDRVGLNYDDKTALKDISLDVSKGEVIALIGSSGGGKSSVINLILRFFHRNQGELLINGESINHYSIKSLRNQISIVTQRIYIFNDTIAANVAYGDTIDEEKVVDALKAANIYDHVQTLPEGIHTRLSESGTNLSGGQRQRIAIARALYKNPSVLILDEATSSLDHQSESAITDTIRHISREIITIIIAHRLKSTEVADRIYLFNQGEIVCSGTMQELQTQCEHFKTLYSQA